MSKETQKKKKIGVIGLVHGNNIGNNLIKYAISIKLSELGFIPYIIGFYHKRANSDISFINRTTNLRIIKKSFSEIKRNDYDILMVNSDQTWRKYSNYTFYDIAFLHFAKNWKMKKFIYGASLGFDNWTFTKNEEKAAKDCLKNFKGISVREKEDITKIKKYLGFNSVLVLDPTFLIDKQYYLNIINGYKRVKLRNKNFILTYLFSKEKTILKFIKDSSINLKYDIFNVKKKEIDSIKKFIFGIQNCKAVITNSYHGTVFSIIFNKSFVSFISKNSPKNRFISLAKIFGFENRIFEYNEKPNINILKTPLNINITLFNSLKIHSINFLKKSLGIR